MLLWVNAVLFGALFGIWSKNSLLNAVIKLILLGAMVANVVAAVKG